MKTWEMIKELTENPSREFTRKSDGLHIKANEHGELIWDSGYQFLRLHHDWEEIKKPVDFMTAFRAYREGKTILSVSKARGKYRYRPYQDFKNDFHEDDIASDEWYIED